MAEQHIANVARTLMGKLRVTWEDAINLTGEDSPATAHNLFNRIADPVREEINKMRYETMGRILAQGRRTTAPAGTLENLTSLAQAREKVMIASWARSNFLSGSLGRRF